jgi:hypothetical protein
MELHRRVRAYTNLDTVNFSPVASILSQPTLSDGFGGQQIPNVEDYQDSGGSSVSAKASVPIWLDPRHAQTHMELGIGRSCNSTRATACSDVEHQLAQVFAVSSCGPDKKVDEETVPTVGRSCGRSDRANSSDTVFGVSGNTHSQIIPVQP